MAILAAADASGRSGTRIQAADEKHAERLIAADLAVRRADGSLRASEAGRKFLARVNTARTGDEIDPFLAQHIAPALALAERPEGPAQVRIDQAESPLAWLARRKGRDGRPLIAPEQLQAGERLRAEFTRAQLTPRVTSNWSAVAAPARQGTGGGGAALADAVVAARQRVRQALEAAGPEFSGLLLDVCCFLKGLEDVERERQWPPRSAKVVLQLALDRLARHYGLAGEARGRERVPLRMWAASDAPGAVDGG